MNGMSQEDVDRELLDTVLAGLELYGGRSEQVSFTGEGRIPGYYAYTDVLAATLAGAGVALSELMETLGHAPAQVQVDRRLVSIWADHTVVQSVGPSQKRPSPPRIGGEYPTADGRWLRITDANLRLQQRMLTVLGTSADREQVAAEILRHNADEIEQALLDGGGAASASRTMEEWAQHPAGKAVLAEPLVDVELLGSSNWDWQPTPGRPLAGIRVLDCTRAVAGPMATRLLAGFGAEVLRLDPPFYDEWDDRDPTQLTLGKRCAKLDLKSGAGCETFLELLSQADVFVHGFRAEAFDELGLGAQVRESVKPDIIEITHNAYGWTGPWGKRRGFDSTVFTASGMLVESMRRAGVDTPKAPGVVQHVIVDHCVGQMEAASAIRAITRRLTTGRGSRSRLSLAGNSAILAATQAPDAPIITGPQDDLYEATVYKGIRGPVRRLKAPLSVTGNPFFWERPGELYGSSAPAWAGEK